MDIDSLASAYSRISALGFPFMLFLALVGSYLEVYYWGKPVKAERAVWDAREKKLEEVCKKVEEVAALREKILQERVDQGLDKNDQLMDKVMEAVALIRESARIQASR